MTLAKISLYCILKEKQVFLISQRNANALINMKQVLLPNPEVYSEPCQTS